MCKVVWKSHGVNYTELLKVTLFTDDEEFF